MLKATPHPVARRLDVSLLVFGLLLIALLVLVVNPLVRLVWDSLHTAAGDLSWRNYAETLGRARPLKALLTSMGLGAAVTVIALALGVPLALGVSRTNMPGRGFTHISAMAAFVMPPFLGAIAWILLAGPNAGWLNRAWLALFGGEQGPFRIFSFWGLAFVIALYAFPLVYVFTRSALDLISSEMEEAAAIHGADKRQVLWKVTLPLALPAMLGAAILVFLESVALYGAPALIAIPAGINVATTQLASYFGYPLRVETAAAFAMPIVLMTALLLLLQRVLLAKKGYVAVSGKGGERRALDIGRWRWLLLGYAALVSALAVIVPLAMLLVAAFSKAWGRGLTLDNLTLANFHQLFFEQATARSALFNTLSYSLASALACAVIGLFVAYAVQRRLTPWPKLVYFLAIAPIAVPGIVLAIGLYAAYAGPPWSLYGSGLLIVIAFITRFLPIGMASAMAAVRTLNPELEEAVRIFGGSRITVMLRVVLPLLKTSFLGAFILIFIICTRELSTAIFLSGPQSRVVSVLTLDLSEQGNYEVLSAMGVVLVLVTTLVVALGVKVAGRDFMLRRT